jgi:hypothetical protein
VAVTRTITKSKQKENCLKYFKIKSNMLKCQERVELFLSHSFLPASVFRRSSHHPTSHQHASHHILQHHILTSVISRHIRSNNTLIILYILNNHYHTSTASHFARDCDSCWMRGTQNNQYKQHQRKTASERSEACGVAVRTRRKVS